MMMRKPVEWGVGRFINKKKHRCLEVAYWSEEDIAMELYLLFDHCVDLFKVDETSNLSVYYRQGIQRRVDKILQSRTSEEISFSGMHHKVEMGAQANRQNDGVNEEKLEIYADDMDFSYDMLFDDMERMGISREHKDFIKSRLSNEKMTEVMGEMKMNRAQYRNMISEIKNIFGHNGYK